MKISTYQLATRLKFSLFNTGLLKIQKENRIILGANNLVASCIPYFSTNEPGILYRRDLPSKIKIKVKRLLGQIFI